MIKYSKDFEGTLKDTEVMKLIGISILLETLCMKER